MATAAEKRAWLVVNGHPELEGGRGRLSDAMLAEWDAGHEDYGPGAGPLDFVEADDPGDDYPDPGTGAVEAPAAGLEPAATAAPEERPGRPHRDGRTRADQFVGRLLGRPKPEGRRKPHSATRRVFPRLSVAPLIEDAYADLASVTAEIPPLQRLFYAQAPIAGVVLDPVVKDTVVDRVLQPVARNYERSKVAAAMLGTSMTLMAVLGTAPQPVFEGGVMAWEAVVDEEGRPVLDDQGEPVMRPKTTPVTLQHKTAMVSFRWCVRAMADLGGDSLRRVQERAEQTAERDALVDEFMAFILGVPVAAQPEQTREDEAGAAGLRLAGVAT
jgi:hypothetical protein